MIDLTLSSEDEGPPKRRRGTPIDKPQPTHPTAAATAAPAPATHAIPPPVNHLPQQPPADSKILAPLAQPPSALLYGLHGISSGGGDTCAPQGLGSRHEPDDGGGVGGGGDTDDFDLDDIGSWLKAVGRPAQTQDTYVAQGEGGGGSPGGTQAEDEQQEGEPKRKRGGGRGRKPPSEEQQERKRAAEAEKAAKRSAREREKAEKEAAKLAERERKAADKRAKEETKQAAKQAKETGNALKSSMVGRHMRLLASNCLAASPLGLRMVDLAPAVRGGAKDQTFPMEVHRDMPLAGRGYRYCMWGVRLPPAATARVVQAEGGSLETSGLQDPQGSGQPLLLFPALLLVLSGDELLSRLDSDPPGSPLAGLYGDVAAAHPGASLLVYVVGLGEAVKRRERANKAFRRSDVEDMLMDVAVGMPAVRLQTDCPESDLARAATDILNLGYALSQQPRKRLEAYLEHWGTRTTVPLRAVKDTLAQSGSTEQLILCEALSQLVAPQRAAAVAAEYPSLAAIMEALKGRPEGAARNGLLVRCRIPGVVPGKHKQLHAGPAAAASVARFLQVQNGRDEWKDVEE